MSQEHFSIVYDGPALACHAMDVRDLAPALLALGELFEEANYSLNRDRAKVAVQVHGSFKTGCFRIDLTVAQHILEQLSDLFATRQVATAKDLLEWLGLLHVGKGLLALLVWLKGRRPTRVEVLSDRAVKVYVDTELFETEQAVLELYRNILLRKALEAAIASPLQRHGIDSFALIHGDQAGCTVGAQEALWLRAPEPEDEAIDDSELVTSLQIVNVAFRDDNKWRFSDGAGVYHAAIADRDFLQRVNKNEESFAKGDILKVRLRKQQWLSGEAMKTEYTVLEVLEHRRATVQLRLPFDAEHDGDECHERDP